MMTPRPTDTKAPARRSRRGHIGSIWPTRRDLTGCYVTITRSDENRIDVVIQANDGRGNVYAHSLDRHEARLLAKRINECLDATVIR
jgi:hypothetical protein